MSQMLPPYAIGSSDDCVTLPKGHKLVWAYDVVRQRDELLTIKFFDLGRDCLSEDECIAQGINFAAYERGVSDAIDACFNKFDAVRKKIGAAL